MRRSAVLVFAVCCLSQQASGAESAKLAFDTYSGYFVSNKFESDTPESFVVITDQEQFDKVFGVAFVMGDKSHRLPKDAFRFNIVLAAIKRGKALWEYEVEGVTEAKGLVEVRYTATAKKSDTATFACPLIVSIPKGKYTAIQFVENEKPVRKVEISKKEDNQRREVHYSGRVQGVGFRQTALGLAKRFAVSGFVKNLPDGRVHLIVEGQPTEIESLLAAIKQEMGRNITKVEETTGPAMGHFQGFEVRYR